MRLIYYGGYANAIICLPEDSDKTEMDKEKEALEKINEKRKEFEKKEGKEEKEIKDWKMKDLNIKYLRDMISFKLKEKKIFGLIPYEWFSSGISEARPKGLAIAFFIGFWVSKILFIVFLVR